MHINVFYNLANLVKLDPERSSEALQLYNRALSMKVDMVEAYINKGDLLLKLDCLEEAKQSFLNAVKYNPNYVDAHFNLSSVYLRLEDRANAEIHYKKALAIDPRHPLNKAYCEIPTQIHSHLPSRWLVKCKSWKVRMDPGQDPKAGFFQG